MLAPLMLIVIGVVGWMFLAPTLQFLPAFSRMLTAPTIKQGLFGFLTGRAYAAGQFGGRDVAIRLQQRRSRRYQMGYLVVAVRTNGPAMLDANGIEAQTPDEAGRRALFVLAANDLLLSVEDGWLKTMWKPVGFTFFPGRFEEGKWRPVLEAMRTVAASLEA